MPCKHNICDDPTYVKGWCRLHYDRQLTGRDMDRPKRAKNKGELCAACCGRPAFALGYCKAHYNRQVIGADMDAPIMSKAAGHIPEYYGAHQRVRAQRGQAANYPCVDCGKQAKTWAYSGLDPNEILSAAPASRGCRYSADPSYYEPKCRKCHLLIDKKVASEELYEYRLWKHQTGLTLADLTPT